MTSRIDHILLNATTSPRDIDRLLSESRKDASSSRGIVVPSVFARRVVDALRGSNVRVASVVAYPLGLARSTVKAIEATSLAKNGVDAVEVTPLAHLLIDRAWDALRDELIEIVRGVRAARPTTTIHVRLDLDTLGEIDLPSAADAIRRGACDGVVLEARAADRVFAAYDAFEGAGLERKLVLATLADPSLRTPDAVGIPFRAGPA